jgi:DNA topoisomerase IA
MVKSSLLSMSVKGERRSRDFSERGYWGITTTRKTAKMRMWWWKARRELNLTLFFLFALHPHLYFH